MQSKTRRFYEMFLRVDNFLTVNAGDFSDISFVAATVAALKTETAKLGVLSAEKVQNTAAAKDSTLARGNARSKLFAALDAIAFLWRSAVPLTGEEKNKFRLPQTSDQNQVATAKTFAVLAEANKQFFLDRGMPADFITALQDKTAVFETAISSSQTALRDRVGINASFTVPLRSGRDAVKNLDPIVRRVYAANPQKLAQWTVASHVERRNTKPPMPPVSVGG